MHRSWKIRAFLLREQMTLTFTTIESTSGGAGHVFDDKVSEKHTQAEGQDYVLPAGQ